MIIFLWSLFGVVLLFVLGNAAVALAVHCRFFNRRYEGNKHLRYFQAEDFPGLRAEPVSFLSDRGDELHGFIYTAAESTPKGLILFSHGFGAGHLAYTTEINTFARAGYTVFAYDATGCGESGGKYFRGFDQGPADLRAAIRFAKTDERLSSLPRILVGHSWGAFSVMNNAREEVKGAVAMCGFLTSADIMAETISARFHPLRYVYRPMFALNNRIRMGKSAGHNSLRSLAASEIPVLLLYGEKDDTVPYAFNGAVLEEKLKGKKNIRFLKWKDKGHNVYLTERAEAYMREAFGEIAVRKKKGKDVSDLYAALDYGLLTEEDGRVISLILSFCESLISPGR